MILSETRKMSVTPTKERNNEAVNRCKELEDKNKQLNEQLEKKQKEKEELLKKNKLQEEKEKRAQTRFKNLTFGIS
jgi:predicted nuclease with TOPRIM domain